MSYKHITDIIILNENETKQIRFKKNLFNKTPIINILCYENNSCLLKNTNKFGFEIQNCSNKKIKINYVVLENKTFTNKSFIKSLDYENIITINDLENSYTIDLDTLLINKFPKNENIIYEIYENTQNGNLSLNNNILSYNTSNELESDTFIIKAKLEKYQDIFELITFNLNFIIQNELNMTNIVNENLSSFKNVFYIDLNTLIINKIPENETVVYEIHEQPQTGNLFLFNSNVSYTKDFNFQGGLIDFKIKAKLQNYEEIFQIITFNLDFEIQKFIELSYSYRNEEFEYDIDQFIVDLNSLIIDQYPQNEQISFSVSTQPQNGQIQIIDGVMTYTKNNLYYGNDSFFIKFFFNNYQDIASYIFFDLLFNEPVPQFETIGNLNFSTTSSSFSALQLKYNHNYTSNNSTAIFFIPTNDLNNINNFFSIDLLDNTNVNFYILVQLIQNATNLNLYYINDINDIENNKIQKGRIFTTFYNSGAILSVGSIYYFWFNSSNNSWYYSNERFPYL